MPQKTIDQVKEQTLTNLQIYMDVALHGPIGLLTLYGSREQIKETLSNYTSNNAREYIIGSILTEIQHGFFVFKRRYEYLKDLKELGKPVAQPAIAMEISSLIVEQNVWQRKFVEILSTLIHFSGANEQMYFLHYLIIHELEELNRQQREQRDFFGSESLLRTAEIEKLVKSANSVEKSKGFNLDKCWYLSDDSKKGIKSQKPNVKRKLQSLTDVVKTAILTATTGERVALGFYQKFAYSITSQNIHFTPLRTAIENDLGQLIFGISQLGLLVPRIISRSEQILGKLVEEHGCILARQLCKDVIPNQQFAKTAESGDYVVVKLGEREFLATVREVFRGQYGYEAYRVRYIANQPDAPERTEDIIAGNSCGRVFPKSAVQEIHQEMLAQLNSDPALSDPALKARLTASEVTGPALDQAILEIWNRVLRQEQA